MRPRESRQEDAAATREIRARRSLPLRTHEAGVLLDWADIYGFGPPDRERVVSKPPAPARNPASRPGHTLYLPDFARSQADINSVRE